MTSRHNFPMRTTSFRSSQTVEFFAPVPWNVMTEIPPPAEPVRPNPIAIPETPLMDPETLAFLDARLRASRAYLEYGCGGSTRMAVGLHVPHILSVESDHAFGLAVQEAVQGDLKGIDLQLFLPKLGPTGR